MKNKWCYYIPEAQDAAEHGGYVPSVVEENEPGHSPLLGRGKCAAPWVWGKTLKEAQEICDAQNLKIGVSKEEAWRIVASSLRVSRIR